MAVIPQPVTTTDEILAAIHEEIVALRADLARPQGEPVVLTEPAAKPTARKRPASNPKSSGPQ